MRRSRGRRGPEQKKSDVMIAVDMLTHTFRRVQEAILLTGDLDFKPLIDALVNDGMFVTLWHPPQAIKELIAAADRGRKSLIDDVHPAIEEPKPFDLPAINNGPDSEIAPVLATWSVADARGRVARLMKEDDGPKRFVVTVPDRYSTYADFYWHHDLTILRTYLKEHGVTVPDPSTP